MTLHEKPIVVNYLKIYQFWLDFDHEIILVAMKRIYQGKYLCLKDAVDAHLLGPDYC